MTECQTQSAHTRAAVHVDTSLPEKSASHPPSVTVSAEELQVPKGGGISLSGQLQSRVGWQETATHFNHTLPPAFAGIHPKHNLLGFSAALAPKFHP